MKSDRKNISTREGNPLERRRRMIEDVKSPVGIGSFKVAGGDECLK